MAEKNGSRERGRSGEGTVVQKVPGNFLNVGMPEQGKKRGRSILLALRPPDGLPSGASREGPYNLIPFSSLRKGEE